MFLFYHIINAFPLRPVASCPVPSFVIATALLSFNLLLIWDGVLQGELPGPAGEDTPASLRIHSIKDSINREY